jgi:CubicO group peptidase (beta-lactamase class C family)
MRSGEMRAVAGLVSFCVLTGALAGQMTSRDRLGGSLRELTTFLQEALRRQGIVGASLSILGNGRVVDRELYGSANLAERWPVDEDTIFHWGSVTKTITAIAILQLRDRGRLRLDDPVVQYLPELRQVHNSFGSMDEITIRQLLSHTAGFRQPTWPWAADQPWQPLAPLHWEQVAAVMPYSEILFKPGSQFGYSNLGYVLLGRIIELLTTDDYEVYVDKNIFKPLKMYRSYFDTTPYHLSRHRSLSYFLKDGRLTPGRADQNTGVTVSNGGLNAPLGDMARYLAFLLGAPGEDRETAEVLARSSLEEMWRPQISVKNEDGIETAMGLGFFVERQDGTTWISHGGTQNAFVSRLTFSPDLRIGYLFVVNTIGDPSSKDQKGDTTTLNRQVRDYLLQKVFPLLASAK